MDVASQPLPEREKTTYKQWDLMILGGIMAAVLGYIMTNTTLILTYDTGTLASVHALCQDSYVATYSAGHCSGLNSDYIGTSVLLFGGIVVIIVGVVIRMVKKRNQLGSW